MALRVKEYVINMDPSSWKRANENARKEYDKLIHDKLACTINLSKQHADSPQFSKPLHVDATFYLPYPRNTKAKNPNLWWCPYFPPVDCLQDFLFRAITNAGIWKDASIVVSESFKKIFDSSPRTHVVITELE